MVLAKYKKALYLACKCSVKLFRTRPSSYPSGVYGRVREAGKSVNVEDQCEMSDEFIGQKLFAESLLCARE